VASPGCRRDVFSVPSGVHYLNCAYMSPLPRAVEEVGVDALRRKRFPAGIEASDFFTDSTRLRERFASLVGESNGDRVAIHPSASYGIATAARNISVRAGQNIVLLHEQFPGNVYSWRRKATESDAEIRTVMPPESHPRGATWSERILDAIDSGLPGKLADVAKSADTANTILYIVEGDSAGGSCKQARDNRYHAILPLRGKILNTERARLNRALSNAEIKSIISAVGAGVGRDFEVEDMRYGGIAIFVDADVDGLHIMTLLLTMFWRMMRPMIDAGKLYVARAPLYQLKSPRRVAYAYSDWERDQLLSQWGRKGVTIQRYKGLGEMNPSQLKATVFDVPEVEGVKSPFASPNLFRVTVEDVHQANQMVELWMGARVAPRKARLMRIWDGESGAAYDELDIGIDAEAEAEAESSIDMAELGAAEDE